MSLRKKRNQREQYNSKTILYPLKLGLLLRFCRRSKVVWQYICQLLGGRGIILFRPRASHHREIHRSLLFSENRQRISVCLKSGLATSEQGSRLTIREFFENVSSHESACRRVGLERLEDVGRRDTRFVRSPGIVVRRGCDQSVTAEVRARLRSCPKIKQRSPPTSAQPPSRVSPRGGSSC